MKLDWKAPQLPPRKLIARYTWDGHAILVHEGGKFKDGSTYYARPWTDIVLAQVDLKRMLALFIREQKNIRLGFVRLAHFLKTEFGEAIIGHDWGIVGTNRKRHWNAPTWQTIEDSGDLRRSLILGVRSE